MSAITLSILKPSVNNLSARILVRAAGLECEELDMWGKKGTPEFLSPELDGEIDCRPGSDNRE